jgi:serine/threonine-protein kinase
LADGSAPAGRLLNVDAGIVYRPYAVYRSRLLLGYNENLGMLPLPAEPLRKSLATVGDVMPVLGTPSVEQNAEISPDGQWLAYQSNESGRDEVYVQPFPNVDAGRWPVTTGGGRTPLWSPNGDELFYGTLEGAIMSVRVQPGPTWQHGPAVQVVGPGYFHAGEVYRTFDVSRDAGRFLMIKQIATPGDIVVVQNWHEELKRLVPSN